MENRLDVALVARGLFATRERAQEAIRAGLVTVNGKAERKCSAKVVDGDALAVTGEVHPFVSRGGMKLAHALNAFSVSPEGHVCMDIGASTGGFTDVLLRGGAKKVYAIDVGRGQLAEEIAADPRVVAMEQTNARGLHESMFDERPTLAVMDVSFISIELILPCAFDVLGENGRMISLIKPQFEAGKKALGKNGIVSDAKAHQEVLERLTAYAPTLGWRLQGITASPISGTSGNIEFLGDFVPANQAKGYGLNRDEIRALVTIAHKELKKKNGR